MALILWREIEHAGGNVRCLDTRQHDPAIGERDFGASRHIGDGQAAKGQSGIEGQVDNLARAEIRDPVRAPVELPAGDGGVEDGR